MFSRHKRIYFFVALWGKYNNRVFKFENNKKILVKSNNKLKKNPSIVVNTSRTLKRLNIKKLQKKFKGIFKVSGIDALNFCLLSEGKIDVVIERGLKKVDYLPLLSIIKKPINLVQIN